MSHDEVTRQRFAATADLLAAHGESRIAPTRARLRRLLEPRGDERALDVGVGTGTLAIALAPLVRQVVGLDPVPELLERARLAAAGMQNVELVLGDAHALSFEDESFDLVVSARTIHHLAWPESAIAEMRRVCRTRGRVLVADQIAGADPLDALAHNRIEHLRDPSHVRVLSDQDFRALFDANELVLRRSEVEHEEVDLGRFLDLAACTGSARSAVYAEVERLLAADQTAGIGLRRTPDGYGLTLTVAWYVLEKVPPAPPTTSA